MAAWEAVSVGKMIPGWVNMQQWIDDIGYRADIVRLKSYGVPLPKMPDGAVAPFRAELACWFSAGAIVPPPHKATTRPRHDSND